MAVPNLQRPISILVVDDHGIVREGLTALLERHRHIHVVGTASTGSEAIDLARRLRPDAVVMDLMLPDMSGVDATRKIMRELPDTRVVVLSICCTSEHVFRALQAGAKGYLLKQSAGSELVHAVAAVLNGSEYVSPLITEALNGLTIDQAKPSPLEQLSARERQVLQMAAAGVTSAQIALRLSLSPKTIETYRCRIMGKLGLTDQNALIRFAIQHALTPM